MSLTTELVAKVADARKTFIDEARKFSESESKWKATPERWCATEITEHLFWAEQGGVLGMWKAIHAHKQGKSVWEGDEIYKGLPIEEVINRTWKEKEIVPAIAASRMNGPIKFWIISLAGLQQQLDEFVKELTDADLSIMTYPHPISGPLNMRQRFEFLRFHLNRHEGQVREIQKQMRVQCKNSAPCSP